MENLKVFELKWGLSEDEPCRLNKPEDICNLVKNVMGFNDEVTFEKVQVEFDNLMKNLVDVTNEIKIESNNNFDIIVRINRILEMVYYACNTYIGIMRMREVMDHVNDYRDNMDVNLFRFKAIDLNENSKYQNFLLYVLESFYKKGYGRYNGSVYSKILVNDKENNNMFDSKAWKYIGNINEILYDLVSKETNYDQFINMTSTFGVIKNATEYITNCKDAQFKEINKDRTIFSFTNGIYKCRDNKFISYQSEEYKQENDTCAAKYFDMGFELKDEWRDIYTPYFDSIFQYQELSDEVIEWIYVMTGRLIYEIGDKDGWQVMLFVQGQAGTGKSTYTNSVCKEFFDDEDVGIMSNNIQPKFGLSDLVNCKMWIAPEIKRDFSIEQGEFQSIITGEKVTINIKHQKSKFETWSSPGVMAGNECPDFVDNAGSIQRRLIPVRFTKKVKKGDLLLGKKMKGELANIIQKCNRAYIEYSDKYGTEDVWGVLPQYFKETQKELACSTNALISFLNSDRIKAGENKFIPEKIFIDEFNDYCKTNNYTKHRFNPDYYLGPFAQFDVKVQKNVRKEYNGHKKVGTYFVGIDVDDVVGEIVDENSDL